MNEQVSDIDVSVVLMFESDFEANSLRGGLLRTDISTPLRGQIDGQTVIAGAIALRILVDGIQNWVRPERGSGLIVDFPMVGAPVSVYRVPHVERGFVLAKSPDGDFLLQFPEQSNKLSDLLEVFARRLGRGRE
jgi:hypothetical protein